MQSILAASALALIVLLMLLALDNYTILRPLHRLTAVAHRQLQGNLTVRAENLPPDEFGELGTTFNSLTEQLSASIQDLERQVQVSRKAENALAEERNVLRTLIDHVPDSIYVIDTEGRKTLTNPADLHYIGVHSEAEVLNKTDFEVFDPEMATRFWADNRDVIESQKP